MINVPGCESDLTPYQMGVWPIGGEHGVDRLGVGVGGGLAYENRF